MMSLFSLLESFFFLFLGLTFVLILLMVYHFKKRLDVLEKTNESLGDVCKSIVEEMEGLKHVVRSTSYGTTTSASASEYTHPHTSTPTSTPIPDSAPTPVTTSFMKQMPKHKESESMDQFLQSIFQGGGMNGVMSGSSPMSTFCLLYTSPSPRD